MSLMWMESWGNRASYAVNGDDRFIANYSGQSQWIGIDQAVAMHGVTRPVLRLGKDPAVAVTDSVAKFGYVDIPIPPEGCIFSFSLRLMAVNDTGNAVLSFPGLFGLCIGAATSMAPTNTVLHIRYDGAVFSAYTASGGTDIYGGALDKSLKIDFEIGPDKRSVKVFVDDLVVTDVVWGADITTVRVMAGYIPDPGTGSATYPAGYAYTAYLTDMMMLKNDGIAPYRRPGKHGRVIQLNPTSDIEAQWQTTDGSKTHAELLSSQMMGAATPAYIAAGNVGETDSFEFSDLPSTISDDYGNLTDVSTLQIAGVQASMLLSSFDAAGERRVGFGQRVAGGTINALGQASVAPLAAQMPSYVVATTNPDTGTPFTPADVSALGYTISLDS